MAERTPAGIGDLADLQAVAGQVEAAAVGRAPEGLAAAALPLRVRREAHRGVGVAGLEGDARGEEVRDGVEYCDAAGLAGGGTG